MEHKFECNNCQEVKVVQIDYNRYGPFFYMNLPKGWIFTRGSLLCKKCCKELEKVLNEFVHKKSNT